MTAAQAAKVLGCNARSVRTMISQGRLKASKVLVQVNGYAREVYDIKTKEVARMVKVMAAPRPGRPHKGKAK